MDVWESNSRATGYTPHPCKIDGFYGCKGEECSLETGVCDKYGCGLNPYGKSENISPCPTKPDRTAKHWLTYPLLPTSSGRRRLLRLRLQLHRRQQSEPHHRNNPIHLRPRQSHGQARGDPPQLRPKRPPHQSSRRHRRRHRIRQHHQALLRGDGRAVLLSQRRHAADGPRAGEGHGVDVLDLERRR